MTISTQHVLQRFLANASKWDQSQEEAAAEFAKFCTRNGFSVRRSIADQHPISRIPIRYPDGWQLLSGGGRFAISESTAQELMNEIYGEEE